MKRNFLVQTIVQNSKKFLQQIQSYEDAQFSGPKWSIYPNDFFFFRKPVNEPCFFYSFLSSGQGRGSGKVPKFDPKMLKQ